MAAGRGAVRLLARAGALPGGDSGGLGKSGGELQIYVRLPDTGDTVCLCLPADGTVADCSEALASSGAPPGLDLYFQGQRLRASDALSDAGLSAQCVIEARRGEESVFADVRGPEAWVLTAGMQVDPANPRRLTVGVGRSFHGYGALLSERVVHLSSGSWSMEVLVQTNSDGRPRRSGNMDERYKVGFVNPRDFAVGDYFTGSCGGIFFEFDGTLHARMAADHGCCRDTDDDVSEDDPLVASDLGPYRPRGGLRVCLQTTPQRLVKVTVQERKGFCDIGEDKAETVTEVEVPADKWPTGPVSPFVMLNAAADIAEVQ
eukprot:TRINITY_DN6898_c0_g1_i2.p1 TRINITY_DN6898_c0_g1~~TRINITY_DN6898_c0_g1_i2.p1  ORF type:complete len:344 (+),score=61.74 TRINITY_DN6898_c0_g1_i2:84-1034(+)